MTEREKRIEKMARDMCNRKMTCEECIGVHGDIYFRDKSDCKYCFAATRAYNAGYRKEEEVQKETAEKIYNFLRSKRFFDSFLVVDFDEVRNICEEFGAEVKG